MNRQYERRPTDHKLSELTESTLPDAQLYTQLRDAEKRLDTLITRKRLDLQDVIGRSMRRNKTLRIFVSSAIHNAAWQPGAAGRLQGEHAPGGGLDGFDFGMPDEPVPEPAPEPPAWSLRVEGRLIDHETGAHRLFSTMFTSIIVELRREGQEGAEVKAEAPGAAASFGGDGDVEMRGDELGSGSNGPGSAVSAGDAPNGTPLGTPGGPGGPGVGTPGAGTPGAPNVGSGPDAAQADALLAPAPEAPPADPNVEVVEWHEVPPHSTEPHVDFDGLDVRRPGDGVVHAKIIMQLKEYPDKFKLSPALQKVLGISEESKPGVVVSLWQYIRFHKLQDVDEKRLIKCDAALRELFGRETITFPQLVELLTPHLHPRDPIVIDYVIDPTQALDNRDVAFDVPLQVDDPLRQDLIAMLDSWYQDQSLLRQLDEQVLQDVQHLNLLAQQRAFYTEMKADPSAFLDKWVASQARDLKIIYSDRQFSEEAARHSSFYTGDALNQSIHLFLNNH